MSTRQDRQGVRTAADLERKYNFGQMAADIHALNKRVTTAAQGGTGLKSVTEGSYLVGNGTEPMQEKTPEEVLEDIGAIGFKRILTSEDDLDELTEPGVYRYLTSSVPANCPYDNAGMIEVIPSNAASGVIQKVTRYGTAGHKKERIKYGGTWLDWVQVPLAFYKTYTATTNSNGNVNTSISLDYRILSISAADADGNENYLCNLYKSTASGGRWFVNITNVTSKANVASTEFTLTIYYMVA